MGVVRLCRPGLAAAVVLLVICGGGGQARAQERAKIEVVPSTPHSSEVSSVAFSPDGARMLSGSLDKTIKLWDAGTGALLRTFHGHSNSVTSVAISPDGTRVLSGSEDKSIKLWDAVAGVFLRTLEGHSGTVQSVAFSPKGARILSGSEDKSIKLWDAATGALLRTFEGHSDTVQSVAFSPNGAHVLSSSLDGTMRLWDAASGGLVRIFEGHSSAIMSVAFSRDGAHALSGSQDDTMRLWDAATGALLRTFEGHSGGVETVAFSPDGGLVLSGSLDNTIRLWDAATGSLLRTFEGYSGGVKSVAFSPDGASVLSGSGDNRTITLWDVATGALLRTVEGHLETVRSVAFSPNGARVLGGWGNTIKLWDTTSGALLRTFEAHADTVESVAFSRDGARMLSSSLDNTIRLWDAATGSLLRTFEGHSAWVAAVAFSPDGTRVLSGSWDKTVRLWDAATGTLLRTFNGHSKWVTSVAFSPDGTRVLSGSWDNTIRLWSVATGTLLRTFEGHSSVAFSPNGARVLGGWSNTIRLWDAATGALLHTFEGHSALVDSVVFSPDGIRVLSGSSDRTIRLWDAATGALLRTLEGHSHAVNSVAFSLDGLRIVSGSDDTTLRVWDTATGAQVGAFIGGRDGQWLTMTPAGFFASSPKGTDLLNVVRGFQAYSAMQIYDHLHRPDLVEERLKGDREGKYKDASRRLNLETILDSGRAPRIELLPSRTEKRGEKVKLAARLVDQDGGGIGPNVLWRVNGVVLGTIAPPSLGRPISMGDYVVMEQTFTVDPTKKNEVEIIAYNGKGLLATRPERFTIDAWGVTQKERPRLFVLAIGVAKYAKTDWRLRYAAEDATALAEALKLVGSPLFSSVHPKTLLDEQVTERAITAEFERLSRTVKARDVFVLFLGGHGRSFAGEGWYYLPQDFDPAKNHRFEKDAISSAKLRDWLAKVPAEKSLIVLDACESGAFDAFRGGDRERETVMAQLEYSTGRNLLTAAPAGRAAYEGHNGHGVLTFAILERLNRAKGAPPDPVSVFELAAHVSREVPSITQRVFAIRQQPRFTPTGGDFPLGLRAPVLKDAPLVVSTTPTHVNPEPLEVFKEAGGKGGMVLQLQSFSSVTVITSEGGWAHIGRDGKALGYVRERQLKKLN
jgi:WD40 repeat protein